MSQFPAWTAGQRVTAGQLLQGLPYMAVKPAQTSRASTTTLAADPDLVITVPASGTFTLEGYLNYSGGTLGSSDLKMAIVHSGTTSFTTWGVNGINTTSTAQSTFGSNGFGLAGTEVLGTSGGNFFTADIKGLFVASTSGTVTLYWSQNTSSATATNLRQGCWLRILQVS